MDGMSNVNDFLYATSFDRVVKIDIPEDSSTAKIYYRDKESRRMSKEIDYLPFCWCTARGYSLLYTNDLSMQRKLSDCGIQIKSLYVGGTDGRVVERLKNGYCYLVYADVPMSFRDFAYALSDRGVNIKGKNIMVVPPDEQVMIKERIRLFKGYENYSDLERIALSVTNEYVEMCGETIGHCRFPKTDSCIKDLIEKIQEANPDVLTFYGGREMCDGWIKQTLRDISGVNITDAHVAVLKAMALDSSIMSDDITYIAERLDINDKENAECCITESIDFHYNQAYFYLAKMLPMSFEKACTIGNAGIWQSIMLAWSFEKNIAIPSKEDMSDGIGIGGMSRMFVTGVCDNVIKIDYNSFYPNIVLSYNYTSEVDICAVMPKILKTLLDCRYAFEKKRDQCLAMAEEYKRDEDFDSYEDKWLRADQYDNMQKPFKIFANAMYGSVSSDYFNWNSSQMGRLITATGRRLFRLLISHFNEIGYTPTAGTTDGCNFILPTKHRYTQENPYYCPSDSKCENKYRPYYGMDADIQEFNDKYLRGTLAVSVEDIVTRSINIRRGNYAELMADGRIKIVGGILRSRSKLPYINEFMSQSVRLLFDDKGGDVVSLYRDMVYDIYNFDMPPQKLAETFIIPEPLEVYQENTRKNIEQMSVGMEVALKSGKTYTVGDVIRFVHTGSSADSPWIEERDGRVVVNAEDISLQTSIEYNADLYITTLHKAACALLACFDKKKRESLFPVNPRDMQWFANENIPLVSHQPVRDGDEDNISDALVEEEKEKAFWKSLEN